MWIPSITCCACQFSVILDEWNGIVGREALHLPAMMETRKSQGCWGEPLWLKMTLGVAFLPTIPWWYFKITWWPLACWLRMVDKSWEVPSWLWLETFVRLNPNNLYFWRSTPPKQGRTSNQNKGPHLGSRYTVIGAYHRGDTNTFSWCRVRIPQSWKVRFFFCETDGTGKEKQDSYIKYITNASISCMGLKFKSMWRLCFLLLTISVPLQVYQESARVWWMPWWGAHQAGKGHFF